MSWGSFNYLSGHQYSGNDLRYRHYAHYSAAATKKQDWVQADNEHPEPIGASHYRVFRPAAVHEGDKRSFSLSMPGYRPRCFLPTRSLSPSTREINSKERDLQVKEQIPEKSIPCIRGLPIVLM
ncbi:hypothetical protein VNI00_005790 [Paramarasmius palmivorus]|uniref:Uncharacterized protein n=1 Tax=Paramarasmius palmivorus TaxID=297713 RepID=A0AAW0DDH6_9AGAR